MSLQHTPIEDLPKIRDELRAGFATGKTKSIEFRRQQLLQLGYLLQDNDKQFKEAFAKDLGRGELESGFLELGGTISEALMAYKNVASWAKPDHPPFNMSFFAMKPKALKEPKGTVLIIGPFNYPIWCLIIPVIGAMAAGNAVVLKPSDLTPNISNLLAELFPKYVDSSLYRVVNGGIPETTKLLELQWDHIFYTGNGRVGRIIATAAAKHLTPVSLELGGKSPVIIDPKTDLKLAARRILWGKNANAGQTCVAPDYVLVPEATEDAFVNALMETYAKFYPEGPQKDVGCIVNDVHWRRLKALIDDTKGTIVAGGAAECDQARRYIAPTIVRDVKPGDALLKDEIFGPILPIVPVRDVDAALDYINAHDRPLATYIFSSDAALKTKVINNTQSGGISANEVLLHVGPNGLPFGGTGPSGSGYHTGKYGFDEFTHLRACIDSPAWIDKVLGARFPPYTEDKQRALARLGGKIKYPRPGTPQSTWKAWAAPVAGVLALVAALTWRARK